MRQILSISLFCLAAGVVFAGCGSGNAATTQTTIKSVANVQTSTPPQRSNVTTEASSAPAPASAPEPKLQGIGETDAVWDATHTADNQFRVGTSYDPRPNSIYGDPANPNNTDKYVGTVHQYGVVTDYDISLNQGVSQDRATSIAMAEMPTDATVLNSAANPDGCYIITLHSNQLASSLAQNDSQNQGGIIIELDTVGNNLIYSPSNVNSMDIRLAKDPSDTTSPSCVQ